MVRRCLCERHRRGTMRRNPRASHSRGPKTVRVHACNFYPMSKMATRPACKVAMAIWRCRRRRRALKHLQRRRAQWKYVCFTAVYATISSSTTASIASCTFLTGQRVEAGSYIWRQIFDGNCISKWIQTPWRLRANCPICLNVISDMDTCF